MARFRNGAQQVDFWTERDPGGRGRVFVLRRPGQPEERTAMQWDSDAWRRHRALSLEHYQAGWIRDIDPARELEDDEPRDEVLEAALRADPGDAAAALVYADWLQQRGHPRGALIAVQHARSSSDTPELAAEEARLLEEEPALLWPLDEHVRRSENGRLTSSGLELTWERGFLRRARLDGGMERGESEELLWHLLRHPAARFLRELEIGCHHWGDQDNELVCEVLMSPGLAPPPLRRLAIGDFDEARYNGIDISRAPLGDLSRLSAQFPMLEDVMLKGVGSVELGDLDLPRARVFAIKSSTLHPAPLAAIARAAWPALEELELWFGDGEYGGDCTVPDVLPLLSHARFPALTRLRLRNTMLSDELCEPLIHSSLAPHLEELDFALGTLSDDGAELLARHRAAFPALRSLNAFACALSGGLRLLRESGFPVEERPPSPGQFDGDHEWTRQKRSRYVSETE